MARNKNKKAVTTTGQKQPRPKAGPRAVAIRQPKSTYSTIIPQYSGSLTPRSKVTTSNNGDLVLVGSELVGQINQVTNGDLNFLLELSPITWGNTRAASYARMFESFAITEARLTLVPACSTASPGTTVMYPHRDPLDAPCGNTSVFTNLSSIMSNQGAVVAPSYMPCVMDYKLGRGEKQSYYCSPVAGEGDIRQCSQGFLCSYNTGTTSNIVGGLYKLDYTIRFTAPTPMLTTQPPNAAWQNGAAVLATTPSTSASIFSSYPSTLTFASDPGPIYEFLVDAVMYVTLGGVAKTLKQYTPIFARYITAAGSVQFFIDLPGAIGEVSDNIIKGSSSFAAQNVFAFFRILMTDLDMNN